MSSVMTARRTGYVESLYRPTDGVCGVGSTLLGVPGGTAEFAISIGALTSRMTSTRRRQIGQLLRGSMNKFAASSPRGR